MIKRINNRQKNEASKIRSVFQVSYAVEAKLLNAVDFPPLKRSLEDFIQSESIFYGYYEGKNLTAAMEVKNEVDKTNIHSLVVHPDFFRKGIASKLLTFLFSEHNSQLFTVETGAENGPAIASVMALKW